jgi:hypothetical protein
MDEGWPKIKARNTKHVSPWMAIIKREVEFAPGAEREIYHAVSQQDYITIVATLPDCRLRQSLNLTGAAGQGWRGRWAVDMQRGKDG